MGPYLVIFNDSELLALWLPITNLLLVLIKYVPFTLANPG